MLSQPSRIGEWYGPAPAWQDDRPRLVVLPFAAHEYDGYQGVYARRLAERLAGLLHASGAVQAAFPLLVSRESGRVDHARLARVPEPDDIRALADGVHADWAVFGRLNLHDSFELDLFVQDVRTVHLAHGESSRHEPAQALEALTVAALQVLRAVGQPPLRDEARNRLFESSTRQPDALRATLLAADLLAHPARTTADRDNGLAYAFAALGHDAAFHWPADLILQEALAALDSGELADEAALQWLERVLQAAPTHHKAIAATGTLWQRGGDHRQAAQAFRAALQHSPNHPYYLFRLGAALDQLDDPGALPTLEAAHAADPANEAVTDLLAARLANAGRLAEARNLWERQLATNPAHHVALVNLGHAHEQAGDLDRAARHYADALQANPTYAPALDRAASLAASQGQPRHAAALLERLAGLRPTDPTVLDRLARAYAAADQAEGELGALGRLTRLRPDHWPAWYAMAARQRLLGRRDEAMTNYRQALNHNPDHVPSLIDLGVLLGGKRQLTEAAQHLGRASRLAPDDAMAVFNYGIVELERGNFAAAEAALERARQLMPNDPVPGRALADLARRRQRGY